MVSGQTWHNHHGNLLDWLDNHTQSLNLGVYMDCCNYPHASSLPSLWKAHYPALKAVISQVGHLPPHPSVLPSLWKAQYPALKAAISQVGHLPPHPSVLPSLWKAQYPTLKAAISQVGHLPPHPSVLPSLWKAHYPALKAGISQVGHLPPSPICSTLSVECSLPHQLALKAALSYTCIYLTIHGQVPLCLHDHRHGFLY